MTAASTRLNAVDAAWRRMDRPSNPMVITSLLTFDEPLTFAEVEAIVRDRLLPVARFRQRVIAPRVGRLRWELDPRFELAAHLRRVALPSPGGQAELLVALEELTAEPLDPDRPPWRIHAIEGYRGGSALVVRIHHCVGDGVALTAMLLRITDEVGAHAAPEVGVHAPHPVGLADRVRRRVEEARTMRRLVMLPSDPPSPLRGRLGLRKVFALSPALPLATLRAAGAPTGATINDVVVAAIAGALERYLAGRGFAGRELRAMLPAYLLGDGRPGELGNHFGLVYLDLPMLAASPAERLAETHRRSRTIKQAPDTVVALELLGALGMAPRWVEDVGIALFTHKASVMITNIAGAPARLHLAGHTISDMATWAPVSGALGLGISILSYAGAARIAIDADAGLVPDPGRLLDGILAELGALGVALPRPPDGTVVAAAPRS